MTADIRDFIGVFPGAVSDASCDRIVEYYLDAENDARVQTRQRQEGVSVTDKETSFTGINENVVFKNDEYAFAGRQIFDEFTLAIWECYAQYKTEYGVLDTLTPHRLYKDVKIQCTRPGQGYHVWHCEHDGRGMGARMMLAMLYLNDVPDGGETEFLYQKRRVKPEKGTLLLCPSGYTHTHRGNPPLGGDKYIINGWVEFSE